MHKLIKYIGYILIIFFLLNIFNVFLDLKLIKDKIPENFKVFLKKTVFFVSSTSNELSYLKDVQKKQELRIEEYDKKLKTAEIEIIKLQKSKNLVNQLIFPQTQLLKLNYLEIELDNNTFGSNFSRDGEKASPFYLEIIGNDLIVFSKQGQSYSIDVTKIKSQNFTKKKIQNNLQEFKNIELLDVIYFQKKLYLSVFSKNEKCNDYIIFSADYNNQKLIFTEFFNFTKIDNCNNLSSGNGGRMQIYNHKNKNGILLSSNNIYFIDFENKEKINFAFGFRNPQGLLVTKENTILVSDHGPRGGDEINKVLYQKNYGWPYSSYGEKYNESLRENDPMEYKKSHLKFGYEEPIFSFLEGIAPSQIIEIDSNFSKKWSENSIYLLSSLRTGSLYRLVLSQNHDRVIGYERIYLKKRIRDLIYDKSSKTIFLAIEDNNGSLGIISNDKS